MTTHDDLMVAAGHSVDPRRWLVIFEAPVSGVVGVDAGESLLAEAPGRWRCPQAGELYDERDGLLTCPTTR